MSFRKLPDNRGLIYVPECGNCEKKHPCKDCFSCQWCSNDRCQRCLGLPAKKKPTGKLDFLRLECKKFCIHNLFKIVLGRIPGWGKLKAPKINTI